jgi:NAD(P)-dependent dehydrogenase (short-subunit alcohol dehydrogenase family)
LDVLVNNAAIGGGDDILATDEATWDHVLAVVLKSVFLCCRASLPYMLDRGYGSIVNISSVNALIGLGEEAYSAAKAGMISLSQNLSIRYAAQGVRTNVICPGTVRTPIWRDRLARRSDIFERLSAWYPVGRVGEPDDVATAAVFLASDEAAFINGAVLTVDGGLTAGLYRLSRELEADSESLG